MKIIFDGSDIWRGLSCIKDAYIDAMVYNKKIDPHNIEPDIKTIVEVLQGYEAVKDMDLIITMRKTNIHDIEISALVGRNKQLHSEINELKKELNSHVASEDKNEGGDG